MGLLWLHDSKENSWSFHSSRQQCAFFTAAQDMPNWKPYRNSGYGFEIAYPADWEFDTSYQDNYGKRPSDGQRPAYAGETRSLFGLEMDGPTQSQEGGGSFDDGAIIEVQITGTSGTVENWNIKPGVLGFADGPRRLCPG